MGAYSDLVLASNPVSYWQFNEKLGTTATDATGTNDGTYVNTPTLGDMPIIQEGLAATFTYNNSEHMKLTNSIISAFPFTVEMWVNVTTFSGTVGLFNSNNDSTNVGGVWLSIDTSKALYIGFGDGAGTATTNYLYRDTPNNTIIEGDTYHIVACVNGHDDFELYLNGLKIRDMSNAVGTGSSTDLGTDQELRIGTCNFGTTVYQAAHTVDDVAIYDYLLQPEQIKAHYQLGRFNTKYNDFVFYLDVQNRRIADLSPNDITIDTKIGTGTDVAFSSAVTKYHSESVLVTNGTTIRAVSGGYNETLYGFTFGCWYYPTSLGNDFFIGIGAREIALQYLSGTWYFRVNNASLSVGSMPMTQNAWNHIVWTYGDGYHNIYVNGTKGGSSPAQNAGAGIIDTISFEFATEQNSASLTLSGYIDDYFLMRGVMKDPVGWYESNLPYYLYAGIEKPEKDIIQNLNPVAYWKLNEHSGTICADSSGNGYHGTYTNSPTLGQTPLVKTGSSVSFASASSQHVLVNTDDFGASHTKGTIEAWFKISSVTANCAIFCTAATATDYYLWVGINASHKLEIYAYDGATISSVYTVKSFDDGYTHHVAFISTGSEYKFYVDGFEEEFTIGSNGDGSWFADTPTQRDNITIGMRKKNSGNDYYFNGVIDQVAVYDYVLTPEQIQKNYLHQAASHHSFSLTQSNPPLPDTYEWYVKRDTPVAYWKLDEESGTTFYDRMGYLNLGVGAGTPTLQQTPHISTGSSVSLDSSTYLTASTQTKTDLIIPGDVTVECWVKCPAWGVGSTYFVSQHGTGETLNTNYTYLFSHNDTLGLRLFWEYSTGVNVSVYPTTAIFLSEGTVYHLAVSRDTVNNKVYFYVDGELKGYNSYTDDPEIGTPDATSEIQIHADHNDSPLSTIIIDEVAVYDYALTPKQIQEHYEAGKGMINLKLDEKKEVYYV